MKIMILENDIKTLLNFTLKRPSKIGLFQGYVWLFGGSDGGPPWSQSSQMIDICLLDADEAGWRQKNASEEDFRGVALSLIALRDRTQTTLSEIFSIFPPALPLLLKVNPSPSGL